MDPNPDTPIPTPNPGLFRYVLGFLLVGAAWGLTTPFMRRAAVASSTTAKPESRTWIDHPNTPWLKAKVYGVLYGVWDVLRNPAYAVPLVINLTGSIWFFLLIGQAGKFCLLAIHVFCDLLVIEIKRNLDVWSCVADSCGIRIESYGADYEFACFLVYGVGRVVGGEEGYYERYVFTFPVHLADLSLLCASFHANLENLSDTWIGMALVLGGIGLCVHSKNT